MTTPEPMNIIVTGGAGFIGIHLVHSLVSRGHRVLNIDKLTYAATPRALEDLADNPGYQLLVADIADGEAMRCAFAGFQPDCIMHLAAESHVDRSIDSADVFIQSNIVGTHRLLEAARHYLQDSPGVSDRFRFVHVSTDEVYGSLDETGAFTESSVYDPRSPYSASKAASDHLVLAWHHTYGLPVILTHCSNNYGPWQFPEKLIPKTILNALHGKAIPVYGRGENVRDWIHVDDHIEALMLVATQGRIGETYNIGGHNEWRNIDLVRLICEIMDELEPRKDGKSYSEQITFVTDRLGHDMRYAINTAKIRAEIGWAPRQDHHAGLMHTIQWYLDHRDWPIFGSTNAS